MCFGNQVQTEKKTTDTTLPSYLSDAAQANVANAQAVASQPFQAYTAPRVADRNADQNSASGLLRAVAGGGDPYSSTAAGLYGTFANTPGATITAPSILGGGTDVNTSTIGDYMNPYVDATLAPTLQAIARQGASARKSIGANATMSGAFGDARHGIEDSNQMRDENTLVGNTVGQAYNNAFNTAAGLRGTDITNAINTQNLTAQNREAALARAAAGATNLLNLDKYDTGRQVDLANALEAQGGKEQATNQAQLDANYQEFMRRQGYSPQMIQLLTQVLAADPGNKATSKTETTEKPDNSGYGILGSLLGSGAKLALGAATGGASLPLTAGMSTVGSSVTGVPGSAGAIF
jgi:hypothetical protein